MQRQAASVAEVADQRIPGEGPVSLLQKVARILDCVSAADGTVGLSELTRRCGVPKSTVYRLCCEMVDWGALERHGDGFRLGAKLFELGARVPSQRRVRDIALPHLQDLLMETGHTTHLAVNHVESSIYLEKLELRSTIPTPTSVGERCVLHASAVGKALLAFGGTRRVFEILSGPLPTITPNTIVKPADLAADLAETRTRGFAIERGELVLGHTSIGAPLFEFGGKLVGAVSITARSQELDVSLTAHILCRVAEDISKRLGHSD